MLLALALLSACGGSDATPTPEAVRASATAAVTATTEVPPAVSAAFPGLPLDKITAMDYDPDARSLTLTTVLETVKIAEGEALCRTFIEVALFAPDASIRVLSKDSVTLATCTRG